MAAIVIAAIVWLAWPQDDPRNGAVEPAPAEKADLPESFTFFDLGSGTQLNESVRDQLSENLGRDAIEKRGTIDLTLNPRGLLETHFEAVFDLHWKLNSTRGARVEHDITRITYRYPWKKNTPFKFVRLVFSNENGKPLYFRMVLKKEGSAIVDTIREKYGRPREIDFGENRVLSWEKNNDALIISQLEDRFGDPEYHVMFYFLNNLKRLHALEQKKIQEKEKELKKAGKTAF